ncbi:MAG TPA: hypothetical protein PK095_03505 [Myxococcota bacterium]|nr:hypothetical protein [Myxococcota bacterium]
MTRPLLLALTLAFVVPSQGLAAPPPYCPLEAEFRPYLSIEDYTIPPDPPQAGQSGRTMSLADNCAWIGQYENIEGGGSRLVAAGPFRATPSTIELTANDLWRMRNPNPGEALGTTDIYVTLEGTAHDWPKCFGMCTTEDGESSLEHVLIKHEQDPEAAEATFSDAPYTFQRLVTSWNLRKAPGQTCEDTTSCVYRMWFQMGSNGRRDGETHYQVDFRRDQLVLLAGTHTDQSYFLEGQTHHNFIPFEVIAPKMPDMADADFALIPSTSAGNVVLVEGEPALKVGKPIQFRVRVNNSGKGPLIGPTFNLEDVSAILTPTGGPTPPWPARIERRSSFETVYTFTAHAAGRLDARRLEVSGTSVHGVPFSYVTQSDDLAVTDNVFVKVSVDDDRLVLEEETLARVRVTSIAEVPIDVRFVGGVLVSTPSGRLTLGEVPELREVYTLTPGEPSIELEVPVRASDGGVAELVSTIAFQGGAGPTTAFAKARVTVSPLLVELGMRPLVDGKPIVGMVMRPDDTLTDLKNNPVEPELVLRVTNKGTAPIAASIESLYPRARDRSPLLDRLDIMLDASTPVGLPIDLETIAAGATVEKVYPLAIFENGRFDFYASVQARLPSEPGSSFRAVKTGAPIAVGEQFPVTIEFKLADPTGRVTSLGNGAVLVAPGGWVPVIATVTNETSNSEVEFRGIEVKESSGNAGNALLTELDRMTSCPIRPGQYRLDPKQSVVLSGSILTMQNGAPKGDILWELPQEAKLIDPVTGDEETIEPEDYLVTTEFGGWLGEPLAVRVVQDERSPMYPPLPGYQKAAHFAYGVMVGIGGWYAGNVKALFQVGAILSDPSALADKLGEGARHAWEGIELMADTWANMTPNEKDTFIIAVGDEVLRIANLDPLFELELGDVAQAYETVRNVTYPLFASIEQAYATNDPAAIAQLYGQVTGNVIMEVVMCFAPSPKFSQYTEGAELVKLAKAGDVAEAATDQARFLTQVPSGPVTHVIAREWWGAGGTELELTQEIFGLLGVKGFMRERAPESFDLINRWGEAVWKPESMKPKGLTDIDLMILGGAENLPKLAGRDRQLDLKGVTALFEPEADDIIEARVRALGADENTVKACLERARFRRAEIQEHAPRFKDYAEGGIPVNKNYADNGLKNPSDAVQPNRAFEVESVQVPGGPTLRIPKMADESGTLKYISGDIDWIHFTFLDGTPLDSDTARMLYDLMHRYVGMQHPETITWIKNGQTVFKGKANQLIDFVKGEGKKALLEVSSDGLRATRIVPELTRFKNGGRAHFIYFDNSMKSLDGFISKIDQLERYYRALDRVPVRKVLLPFLWFGRTQTTDTSMGGCDWEFSGKEDALMLRQSHEGETQQYRDGSWVPFQLPACGTDDKLALTPVTQLTETVPAGTSEVPISELDSDWAAELVGHLSKWFEPGDTVVFAPGEPNQEVRQVVALGSLILDRPLENEHRAGTLVAVVPAGTVIVEPNPEVGPEVGPETGPEAVEPVEEPGDDLVSEPKRKDDGGCGGGGVDLALGLLVFLPFCTRRLRRVAPRSRGRQPEGGAQ